MSSNRFFSHALQSWASRQDFHRNFDDLVPEILVQVVSDILQGLFRMPGVAFVSVIVLRRIRKKEPENFRFFCTDEKS